MDLAATSLLIIISFCAILIDIKDAYGDYGINEYNITLPTVLLFCLQWTIILFFFHYLSGLNFQKHDAIKTKLIYILTIAITISSLIVLSTKIEDIKSALIMDLADVRNEHYKNLAIGYDNTTNYILAIPLILTNTPFPTLALFLWFYMKSFMNINILLRIGILIASILQAITAIAISGRAAMIYWAFDFFLIYSFFYRFLSFRLKLAINLTSSIIGGLAATLFISITIARFSEGTYDPLVSLYGYAGQHINNFCTMIIEGGNTPLLLDREFPLISKLMGNPYDMYNHYDTIASYTTATVNVFDTFGGELYLDLGWVGYISFFVLFLTFFIIMNSRCRELYFRHTFLLAVTIAFFTHGLFAWPFTYHNTTYAIFIMMFIYFLFRFKFKL